MIIHKIFCSVFCLRRYLAVKKTTKRLAMLLALVFIASDVAALAEDLDTLRLPASLETIQYEAFAQQASEHVIIPDGTTTIEARAFAESSNMKLVTIPKSVTYIANDAFENCSEFTIDTPVGSYAYYWGISMGYIPEPLSIVSVKANTEWVKVNEAVSWKVITGGGESPIQYLTINLSASTKVRITASVLISLMTLKPRATYL